MSTNEEVEKTFTSSKGIVLNLLPISQFKIDSLYSSQKTVPVPTYRAETVGGGSQEFPLDEEIAKNKGRLDEWEIYKAQKKIADAENTKKLLEFMIWDGVNIEVPGPESQWQKDAAYFGTAIPEEEHARKLFYVHNELLGTQEDIGNLIACIFAASRVDGEVVDTIRETFRVGIQRSVDKKRSKNKGKVENQ